MHAEKKFNVINKTLRQAIEGAAALFTYKKYIKKTFIRLLTTGFYWCIKQKQEYVQCGYCILVS